MREAIQGNLASRHHRWLYLGCALACACLALFLSACGAPRKAPVESHREVSRAYTPGYHRVQRDETLYRIARRYGLSVATLARLNRLSPPYTIYPGQRLRLRANTRHAGSPRGRQTNQSATARQSAAPAKAKAQRRHSVPDSGGSWLWPTQGDVIGNFKRGDSGRNGIQIAGAVGQPVKAARSGQVVYSGSGLRGYGRLIIVKHNEKYLSAYGHNSKLLVAEGDRVTKGEKIAEMGRSTSGKPMLHFEIRRNGKATDPLRLLP